MTVDSSPNCNITFPQILKLKLWKILIIIKKKSPLLQHALKLQYFRQYYNNTCISAIRLNRINLITLNNPWLHNLQFLLFVKFVNNKQDMCLLCVPCRIRSTSCNCIFLKNIGIHIKGLNIWQFMCRLTTILLLFTVQQDKLCVPFKQSYVHGMTCSWTESLNLLSSRQHDQKENV